MSEAPKNWREAMEKKLVDGSLLEYLYGIHRFLDALVVDRGGELSLPEETLERVRDAEALGLLRRSLDHERGFYTISVEIDEPDLSELEEEAAALENEEDEEKEDDDEV